MILQTNYYNNGYGCSCCRSDWEEQQWVKETDILSFEKIIEFAKESKNHVIDDEYHCGIIYTDGGTGKVLYGFKTKIYRSPIIIYLVIGEETFEILPIYSNDFDESVIKQALDYYLEFLE